MQPKERRETNEQDLFRSRLDQIIDLQHALVRLARAIDWRFLEEKFHGALASSGDYERYMTVDGRRYCHILNPTTGWPCHGLAAVSVMAERCLVAGTISTIAMLKGRDGIRWLSGLGLEHFFVDENGVCGGDMPTATAHSNLGRCNPI